MNLESVVFDRDVKCSEDLRKVLVDELRLPFTQKLEIDMQISIKIIATTGNMKYIVISGHDGFIWLRRRRITDEAVATIIDTITK